MSHVGCTGGVMHSKNPWNMYALKTLGIPHQIEAKVAAEMSGSTMTANLLNNGPHQFHVPGAPEELYKASSMQTGKDVGGAIMRRYGMMYNAAKHGRPYTKLLTAQPRTECAEPDAGPPSGNAI